MKPRLLIFDLDGTLIDSAGDIVTAVNGLAVSRGLDPIPAGVIKAAIGEGLKHLIRDLFPDQLAGEGFLAELERDLKRFYGRHLLDTTKPFPGVTGFLAAAPEKIAVLSNKLEEFVLAAMRGLNLDPYPWVRVYGGDSLAARKPDPLPFLEIMRAAGVSKEETIMIGDGIPDIEGANRCGIRSIACAYGYTDRDRLGRHDPTAWIESFADLRPLLDSL